MRKEDFAAAHMAVGNLDTVRENAQGVPEEQREVRERGAEDRKDADILTAVVRTRCKVLSYNPYSNVLVYERDGKQFQTNTITGYHGEGWIEVE